MVWVRSPRTCSLIEGGSERRRIRQHVLDALHGLIDVVAGLLVDIDDHGALAVDPGRLPDILDAVDRLADVADVHRRTVAIRDDDRLERGGVEQLVGGIERQRLSGAIERALGGIDRRGPDRSADVLQAYAHRRRHRRVDLNPHRRLLLTMIVDLADTGDARDARRQVILDVVVDRRDGQVGRGHGDRHQERVGRVDLLVGRRIGQALGQLAAGRADGGLDVLRGTLHVAAEIELHLDVGLTERAGGADRGDAGNLRQLTLERPRHRRRHGLGVGAGQARGYPDRGHVDLRHARDRQHEIGHQTDQGDADRQQRGGDRTWPTPVTREMLGAR